MASKIQASLGVDGSTRVETSRLGPVMSNLSSEHLQFVLAMRTVFLATEKTLREFAAESHYGPSSVSRYLRGKRIPDKVFLDSLMENACLTRGIPLTDEMKSELYLLHLEALRVGDQTRYRMQLATDSLESALAEKKRAEERIAELEANLSDQERHIRGLALCDEYARDLERQRANLTLAIDRLESRLSQAQGERERAARRCHDLEGQLRQMEEEIEREKSSGSRFTKQKHTEASGLTELYLDELARVHQEADRVRSSSAKDAAALRRLRDMAHDVAHQRLPDFVKQLKEDDITRVQLSVDRPWVHERGEINQLAQAFEEVHYSAINLIRKQLKSQDELEVATESLAKRIQCYSQRQIKLLSELHCGSSDKCQTLKLAEARKLGSLTRRHAEKLLLIAWGRTGRKYLNPSELSELLHTASNEVESSQRIEFRSLVGFRISNVAGCDITRILAEILDNALRFSPPKMSVEVSCYGIPHGRVLIEIKDQGVGMTPDFLDRVNEWLSTPLPTTGSAGVFPGPLRGSGEGTGLAVVNLLAQRHNIRIQMRTSNPRFGTSVLIFLPANLISSDE